MPRVFRLSLRGAQRRGNLVTMPEYVPTKPTEPTRPPRCARNDNGKTESSCRHAGLGQCPVKHPCWKPWLFLDFAHLKGRKRGDLQVGSTGLPGVPEHRGRQTVLQKIPARHKSGAGSTKSLQTLLWTPKTTPSVASTPTRTSLLSLPAASWADTATAAGMDRPHGCGIGANATIYVADIHNHRVRVVS